VYPYGYSVDVRVRFAHAHTHTLYPEPLAPRPLYAQDFKRRKFSTQTFANLHSSFSRAKFYLMD